MKEFTCIVCPKGCRIFVDGDGYMKGAGCARGTLYVADELKNPMRMVTSTVKIKGAQLPRLPVKTSAPIPKAMMLRASAALNDVVLHAPVRRGDIVLQNVLDTGIDFIANKSAGLSTAQYKKS